MHLAHGLHEPFGVAEPLLEQVGHALRAVLEQLQRVLRIGVLRQDHDARPRIAGADLPRELDALGGVGRRHADVEQGHVGSVGGNLPTQLVGAFGGRDHLDLGLGGEHRPSPFAHQVVVLGDHDPDRALGRARGRVGHGRWRRVRAGHALLLVAWPLTVATVVARSAWSQPTPRPPSFFVLPRSPKERCPLGSLPAPILATSRVLPGTANRRRWSGGTGLRAGRPSVPRRPIVVWR